MDVTYKNVIMFYQTTLRNVGLYTSISFAALGYSRYYRGKSQTYNIGLITISLIFNLIAFAINYYLLEDMVSILRTYKEDPNASLSLDKWVRIPKLVVVLQLTLFLFGAYTLFKNIKQ
jgi:hypothetical protein|tara:strand:- start:893 stop:1246 length:354 start_codon:yes stop_codon:yes gene_type:complete